MTSRESAIQRHWLPASSGRDAGGGGATADSEATFDPDLDTDDEFSLRRRHWWQPHRRRLSRRRHLAIVAAVGSGGAIGALGRYGVATAFPVLPGRFPWSTLGINLSGSLLLGVVLYVVFERRPPNRFLRPFLAIGVLGGFTTFSTFAVEIARLSRDRPTIAAAYLAASLVGGPLAVLTGSTATRQIYSKALDRPPEERNRE